ncbi:MAG: 50S ribosomal protein L5 [Candidatus Nanoarchaeia archaeon]
MEIKNKMHEMKVEKMVLNCGGLGEKLDRSVKLLEMITGRKAVRIKSTKRIPDFGISPGKESGCKITIRDLKEIDYLLKRFFAAVSKRVPATSITENAFSFGIKEYIEIPGLEYKREIGMLGMQITLVFTRSGKRVAIRKIKKGKYPKRQNVSKEEIKNYLIKNYGVEIQK